MTATLHCLVPAMHPLVPVSSLLGSVPAACDEVVLPMPRDSTPWLSLLAPTTEPFPPFRCLHDPRELSEATHLVGVMK